MPSTLFFVRRAAFTALWLGLIAGGAAAQETRVVEVAVQARQVKGAADTIRVDQGTHLVLRVASDEAGELHVHGYDVIIDLRAGEPTTVEIDAAVAGRFPITSHGFGGKDDRHIDHRPLLYLEVYPR